MISKLSTAVVVIAAACTFASPALAGPDVPTEDRTAQIAGGYTPAANEWPWVTAIRELDRGNSYTAQIMCSGTLVSPWHVVTAAHCMNGVAGPQELQVDVNRRDIQSNAGVEIRNVAKWDIHPRRDSGAARFDQAVLTLASPITNLTPAPLGTSNDWASWGALMGWGHIDYHTSDEHVFPRFLQAGVFDTLNDATCGSMLNPLEGSTPTFFGEDEFCARSASTNEQYTCTSHGDSGGGFLVRSPASNQWVLIGVDSWVAIDYTEVANGCGPNLPTVYSWVAGDASRPWAASIIAQQPSVVVGGGGGATNPGGSGIPVGGTTGPNLALSKAKLKANILKMIKKRTNLRPIGVARARCSRTSASSFSCKLAFVAARRLFNGKLHVWNVASGNKAKTLYRFKGRRYKINRAGGNYRAIRWSNA